MFILIFRYREKMLFVYQIFNLFPKYLFYFVGWFVVLPLYIFIVFKVKLYIFLFSLVSNCDSNCTYAIELVLMSIIINFEKISFTIIWMNNINKSVSIKFTFDSNGIIISKNTHGQYAISYLVWTPIIDSHQYEQNYGIWVAQFYFNTPFN